MAPEVTQDAPAIDASRIAEVSHAATSVSELAQRAKVFEVEGLSVSYSGKLALEGASLDIARVEGTITYHGVDLYDRAVNPVEVRRRIGMVFQKPNPFPKSIYDNIAFGPRVLGLKKGLDERVERALRAAALWDEVGNRLKDNALGLSGGQQQRLCIARAIAVEPDVILMDEPCSALDPIATSRIEDLIQELKQDYTIVMVTHNMQQAARVADMTAFFSVEVREDGTGRHGILVEYAPTTKLFTNPADKRTEDYVTGRFG